MRNFISSLSTSLLSTVAFAAETETGAALPEAKQPVPDAATIADITAAEAAERKAKAAKLAEKRKAAKAAKAEKPATAKPVGKPANVKAKAASEAKPDADAERVKRIAADRATVYGLYAEFERQRVSVPVKPLSAFKPELSRPHSQLRNPSVRQAAALAVAAAAAGKQFTGTSAITFPRVFELRGVRSCIENGCLRDAISSGLASVSGDSAEAERITVSAKSAKAIIGLIGSKAAAIGKLA